jgi:hypothetical protein
MPLNDEFALKEKVQSFLIDQPLYDPNQQLRIVYDEGNTYSILYGDDLVVARVVGFGNTPQDAFNDFKNNWKTYRAMKSN